MKKCSTRFIKYKKSNILINSLIMNNTFCFLIFSFLSIEHSSIFLFLLFIRYDSKLFSNILHHSFGVFLEFSWKNAEKSSFSCFSPFLIFKKKFWWKKFFSFWKQKMNLKFFWFFSLFLFWDQNSLPFWKNKFCFPKIWSFLLWDFLNFTKLNTSFTIFTKTIFPFFLFYFFQKSKKFFSIQIFIFVTLWKREKIWMKFVRCI